GQNSLICARTARHAPSHCDVHNGGPGRTFGRPRLSEPTAQLSSRASRALGAVSSCRDRIVALGQGGEDRCMTGHQLDPSPSTTVDVFSRDLPPVLTVDTGDTIVLRSLNASGHLQPQTFPGERVP